MVVVANKRDLVSKSGLSHAQYEEVHDFTEV